jgi:excisionase family DNA binding protein
MDMGKLISTSEAAAAVGITQVRIQQLIQRGRLPALRVGRSYVIDEADLKLLEGRQPGRPKSVAAELARTAPKRVVKGARYKGEKKRGAA